MPISPARSLTASETALSGRIAGAVLKALRAHAGLTQDQLAELLGSGLTTVQGWETGRRPLINARFAEVQRIRCVLQAAGVDPEALSVWDQALTADAIFAEVSSRDVETHPLALVVPDRTLTELLAWPLTGVAPRRLCGIKTELAVATGVRDQVAAELRNVVDRCADGVAGAMLRRQAKFLVANHEPSQAWLADVTTHDMRKIPDLRAWTPEWAVVRSHAVSAAVAGDLELLTRFVDEGLATDEGIAANLNYWAYWVGEIGTRWSSDVDMLNTQRAWSGGQLLASLLDGLENAPYRELCAHALWALLRQRRSLLDHPSTRMRILTVTDAVMSTDNAVSSEAKRRLEQISYLAGR